MELDIFNLLPRKNEKLASWVICCDSKLTHQNESLSCLLQRQNLKKNGQLYIFLLYVQKPGGSTRGLRIKVIKNGLEEKKCKSVKIMRRKPLLDNNWHVTTLFSAMSTRIQQVRYIPNTFMDFINGWNNCKTTVSNYQKLG